ncbi:retrovirus-related pol polyprotein from transposon TNT 1-94 [Tanacetum coccineum]|uniref:Retrovirus-related pol polyprotein from transposon TNT 1-94 n=1 Tax=Tanacetum coccineum TaxID=301880 RepID=A0ABQ4XVV8_9ASTR
MRKFLRALLLKWKANVMTIEEAKDFATLPLDELIGNRKVYEMILENDGVTSKTTNKKVKSLALKAKVAREQTSDDSDKCHFISECPKPKENKAFVRRAWSDSEDGVEPQNDATYLMVIDSQEVCLKSDLLLDDWIVDSGCTKNMTGNIILFPLYKACDGGNIVFGSNLKVKVIGGGNISHESITITNVEHVSDLDFNLISVGQLRDEDCVVSFTKVDCTISKNNKMLARGHRRNGLYTFKLGDNSKQQICLASMMDNSMLWNRRLGHANMCEFDKLQFGSFCEQHGMSYNLSGLFTSQSNEIVERTHNKLRKMIRAMLDE